MQRLLVDIFLSADGWGKGETSPGYFGYFGPELEKWISAELAKPQLILLGRRTYEALADLPEEVRDESWHRMTRLDKVVFSRTLEVTVWPNTRICGNDLVAEVRELKRDSDVPLRTMGSLSIARQLCDASLVDQLRLMIFPLLVGPSGCEPVFAGVASTDLKLVNYQALDDRVLLVEYQPSGHEIPSI